MSVQRVATRYAKSLIDLASDQNKLEAVLEDMTGFRDLLEKNRDFYLLTKSPIVNPGKKRSIFNAILEGKIDKLTLAFFNLVIQKGREGYLPEIADAFYEQYKALKGISVVKLRSATPLSEERLASIRKKLSDSGVAREQVQLETEVDPSLIGGFVLEYKDQLYDASVSRKLEEFKRTLAR